MKVSAWWYRDMSARNLAGVIVLFDLFGRAADTRLNHGLEVVSMSRGRRMVSSRNLKGEGF